MPSIQLAVPAGALPSEGRETVQRRLARALIVRHADLVALAVNRVADA